MNFSNGSTEYPEKNSHEAACRANASTSLTGFYLRLIPAFGLIKDHLRQLDGGTAVQVHILRLYFWKSMDHSIYTRGA